MWISDKWQDYELLDCGDGERLERWGKYRLVRPDPQAIWDKARPGMREWQAPDARYLRSSSGGGKWQIAALPPQWQISYGELTFRLKPMNFKHTGLFPEQAVNWDFIRAMIAASKRKISVLNLFAYTGGATLAAASAGVEVCHVDAARGMVAWARENAAVSGLERASVRWIVDDCKKFLEREIRRGRKYDAIIMDPPSYGRGPSGEVWKIEDDVYDFIRLTLGVLSDKPLFYIVNSYTAGLSPSVMRYILGRLLTGRYGGAVECEELGLPVTETGLCLPCGSTGRWIGRD